MKTNTTRLLVVGLALFVLAASLPGCSQAEETDYPLHPTPASGVVSPPAAEATAAAISPAPTVSPVPTDSIGEPDPTAQVVVDPTEPPNILFKGTLANIPFCSPDGQSLGMDIYYPSNGVPPFPVVVYVHGGSLIQGDKSDGLGVFDFRALNRAGFVVASLDYRLSPQYRFPAHLEDVKCGVRFLKAQAALYGLDPERIGAYGTSAGAYLVAMLALTGPEDGFEGQGGNEGYSSDVRAVVVGSGFYSLMGLARTEEQVRLLEEVFGSLDDAAMQMYSPVTYIGPGAPPFLIIHGSLDQLVPVKQAQDFQAALTPFVQTADLVIVENGDHTWAAPQRQASPPREVISDRIVSFFLFFLR